MFSQRTRLTRTICDIFVGNDVAVVEDLTAVPEPFLKIAAYFPDGATEEYRLRIAQAAGGTMRPVVSGMAWVDLLPQDCDKGTALAVFAAPSSYKSRRNDGFRG